MSDQPTAFRIEVPAFVRYEIGRDPAQLPEHEAVQIAAVRTLLVCSSLFWVVRQLGMMQAHGGWVYTPEELANALEALGEVGEALAGAASEQAERLARLAGQQGRSADDGGGGEP